MKEYSLDELVYEASARLKNLPVGQAVVKLIGTPSAHIKIPLPLPGSVDEIRLGRFRAKAMHESDFAQPQADAIGKVAGRQKALNQRVKASSPTEEEPTSFGRPKAGRGKVKSTDGDN